MQKLDIKSVLKKYKTTQKELAKKMGVTEASVSLQVNGSPSVATILRIAAAIGCDVRELFTPGNGAPLEDDTPANTPPAITCPACGTNIQLNPTLTPEAEADLLEL